MDGDVAVVGLGVDAMYAVLVEQLGDHRSERLRRQSGALTVRRERDADLGRGSLIGHHAHSAVATEDPAGPLDRGQLHPLARGAELDIALLGENCSASASEYVVSPRLVARDRGIAAVGDKRRQVVGLERPQSQPLRDDLNHATPGRCRTCCRPGP